MPLPVFYGSMIKQQLLTYAAITDWLLRQIWVVFTDSLVTACLSLHAVNLNFERLLMSEVISPNTTEA